MIKLVERRTHQIWTTPACKGRIAMPSFLHIICLHWGRNIHPDTHTVYTTRMYKATMKYLYPSIPIIYIYINQVCIKSYIQDV